MKVAIRPRLPPPAARPRRRQPPRAPRAAADAPRGASGLDINGSRPTSPRAFDEIKATLRPKVKMYSPAELSFALRRGVPVLDVRPPDEYARGHVDGAVSVPLYRPITGLSPRAVARRAVFAFFGVLNGTEANPDFLADASAALGRRRTCVLICNVGGTMEETETNRAGQMSRSLSAAYELVRAGVVNDVAVLRGGVSGWLRADRETVGE